MRKLMRDLKPDAQPFDEVKIFTQPRYKESGLSGDEWRISATTQFYRKGKLIAEFGSRNIETACVLAGANFYKLVDEGKGYFAGEGLICDQEGCCEKATQHLTKKFEYYENTLDKKPEVPYKFRLFCDKHATRGDCGIDDSDSNYTKVPLDDITHKHLTEQP